MAEWLLWLACGYSGVAIALFLGGVWEILWEPEPHWKRWLLTAFVLLVCCALWPLAFFAFARSPFWKWR